MYEIFILNWNKSLIDKNLIFLMISKKKLQLLEYD